ncbi:Aste57867_20402 [Aphanomyces stellatus]|uniref:Aste57867_20402 protein n=1 Tax=Aphanomyces stellatus TaxID=120398 RepID=A0A485LJL6_9STRA|nr:hypothetical protein As57867_020336 [Aphanomyces stellatus]VFT97088.1 Aste57867_20402 [Aphanomyces stellatus]
MGGQELEKRDHFVIGNVGDRGRRGNEATTQGQLFGCVGTAFCLAEPRRMVIKTTKGNLPMKLRLESNQTKLQWECMVVDMAQHPPNGSTLPVCFVLASLQRPTPQRQDHPSPRINFDACSVDLSSASIDVASLHLQLLSFSGKTTHFTFELAPRAVDTIALLELEVHDLETKLAYWQETSMTSEGMVVASHETTPRGDIVAWVVRTELSPHNYVLAEDSSRFCNLACTTSKCGATAARPRRASSSSFSKNNIVAESQCLETYHRLSYVTTVARGHFMCVQNVSATESS